jgi:hypothetical protein
MFGYLLGRRLNFLLTDPFNTGVKESFFLKMNKFTCEALLHWLLPSSFLIARYTYQLLSILKMRPISFLAIASVKSPHPPGFAQHFTSV